MDFKPNKQKLIVSITVGFGLALINFVRLIFQGIGAGPMNYFEVFLIWPISVIVIYILYSLLEKKK